MRPNSLVTLPLITGLAACSGPGTREELFVDGPKSASFDGDLAQCRTLARLLDQLDAETGAVAVLGAGLGALAGWAAPNASATEGAVGGALGGAAMGAQTATENRQAIVADCTRGRGHKVVG